MDTRLLLVLLIHACTFVPLESRERLIPRYHTSVFPSDYCHNPSRLARVSIDEPRRDLDNSGFCMVYCPCPPEMFMALQNTWIRTDFCDLKKKSWTSFKCSKNLKIPELIENKLLYLRFSMSHDLLKSENQLSLIYRIRQTE